MEHDALSDARCPDLSSFGSLAKAHGFQPLCRNKALHWLQASSIVDNNDSSLTKYDFLTRHLFGQHVEEPARFVGCFGYDLGAWFAGILRVDTIVKGHDAICDV